jgi:hypothetical protein
MGRKSTFYDEQLGRPDFDPYDQGTFERNLVFVAMSFNQDMQEVYSAIKDECTKLGLRATRVDENIGSGFIIREITDLIERAEFIVFDLTHERPNVYYELGYAHGVGNEPLDVLLIAKEGTNIHFDIAPFRVQFYGTIDQLHFIVSSSLKVMIQKTRGI